MRLVVVGSITLLPALGLAACASDGGPADAALSDAAVPDAGTGGPVDPMPPQLACPEGWSSRSVGETLEAEPCEPWAPGSTLRCATGEAWFVGAPGCAPVGPACPAGALPEDLSGVTLYVAASGDGSDGRTPATAFQTLTAALAAASAGDVIAVAKGTYDEAVTVPPGVTLRGACAAGTVVRSPSPAMTATIEMSGSGGALEALSVAGRDRPGIAARFGGDGVLRGVVVTGEAIGLWVQGGALAVDRVLVHDVAPIADGRFGQGAVVEAGGRLTGRALSVVDATEDGLFVADPGSSADLSAFHALGTSARPADGLGGMGVRVIAGATATLEESILESNVQAAALVRDAGSSLTLQDAVIRDTRAAPLPGEPTLGRGVAASGGGAVTLRRTLLEANRDATLFASSGATLDAEDVVVTDTFPENLDGSGGSALAVQGGAIARLSRAVFARNRTAAVDVGEAGSRVEASDLVIVDTVPRDSDGAGGRAVSASFGATVRIERARFVNCAEIGAAFTDGADGSLTEVRITETVGRGIEVSRASSTTLTNVLLERNLVAGMLISSEATVTVDGMTIVGVVDPLTIRGRAIQMQAAAILRGAHVTLRDNPEGGLMAASGAVVELDDVLIADTERRSCAETTCTGMGAGFGATTFDGARLSLTDFEIARSATAGLVVGEGGVVSLRRGRIIGSPIGVNLQDDSVSFEEAFSEVAFENNERNVDATILPLPELTLPEL